MAILPAAQGGVAALMAGPVRRLKNSAWGPEQRLHDGAVWGRGIALVAIEVMQQS